MPFDTKDIAMACLADKKRSGDYITFMMIEGTQKVVEKKVNICEVEGYLR